MARCGSGRTVAALLVAAALASCTARRDREETRAVTSKTIEAVLAAHTDSLMALPGVVGTAIGMCDGAPCIRVFIADASAAGRRRIPAQLEGYPVKVEVTGPIRPRRSGTP
jgi:hypothetical protein